MEGDRLNLILQIIGDEHLDLSNSSSGSSDEYKMMMEFTSSDEDDDEAIYNFAKCENDADDEYDEDGVLLPLLHILVHGKAKEKVQDFLQVAQNCTDEEFYMNFRIKKQVAYSLIQLLRGSGFIPKNPFGSEAISSELCFLMFLRFVSSDRNDQELSDSFKISVSSVLRVIKRVVTWLLSLADNNLKWPEVDECESVAEQFQQLQGIEGCIGALQMSHILVGPSKQKQLYLNQKHSYSLVLQAVIDSNKKFRNISCEKPGSMSDDEVFKRSSLYKQAEGNKQLMFPGDSFILGDGSLEGLGREWLVTPYQDLVGLSNEQIEFNTKIKATKACGEQAMAIFKGRFQCFLKEQNLSDLSFITKLITSCCILHNICINAGDNGLGFYHFGWNINDNAPVNQVPEDPTLCTSQGIRDLVFNKMYNIVL